MCILLFVLGTLIQTETEKTMVTEIYHVSVCLALCHCIEIKLYFYFCFNLHWYSALPELRLLVANRGRNIAKIKK